MRWVRFLFLPAIFVLVMYVLTAHEPARIRTGDHALTAERISEAEALFNVPWKTGK